MPRVKALGEDINGFSKDAPIDPPLFRLTFGCLFALLSATGVVGGFRDGMS